MTIKTREELINEIKEIVKGLDRYSEYEAEFSEPMNTLFFYDENDELAEVFDCGEAAEEALQYYTETANGEAEIKYDGIKFFTIEVVK